MPGKMARSDPRPSVRVTRGAGSGQHLASVLQEGRENANIDAGLGFIWRISAGESQLKATRHIEGERGSAVLRSLFGSLLLSGAMAMPAAAENAPGVTDSEIKIGQNMPYTGPGAWLSSLGLAEKAYMQMINDQGGINGRKINLISVDDGFMPWRTGNETRKLIEVDRVAFIFSSIGTPTQLEVAKYLNERKIPQLFIASGAYRWGNYKATPYT